MFELRHLRYFVAVAEELNFTRAAERLHIAQPSLSQQIRILEGYLGISLLARGKRKVELTSAGHRFLGEARLALAQAEKAIIRARQSDDVESLKIGFTPSLFLELLPRLEPMIRADFPSAKLTIRSMVQVDLEQALKEDEFDIIFTNTISREYDVTTHRLFEESLIAVFPKTHPLGAAEDRISLDALGGNRLVIDTMSMSSVLRGLLEEKCEEHGTASGTVHGVDNFFEALGLILSGCGIGLFESNLSRLIPNNLTFRKLDENSPKSDVVVAHRSGLEVRKLRKLIKISQQIKIRHS